MTYERACTLAEMMLTGDNAFPDDALAKSTLLEYALNEVANTAHSNVLRAKKEEIGNREVIRAVGDGTFILRPLLPTDDGDHIDIDQGLTYSVARIMASVITTDNSEFYRNIATKDIARFNENMIAMSEMSTQ